MNFGVAFQNVLYVRILWLKCLQFLAGVLDVVEKILREGKQFVHGPLLTILSVDGEKIRMENQFVSMRAKYFVQLGQTASICIILYHGHILFKLFKFIQVQYINIEKYHIAKFMIVLEDITNQLVYLENSVIYVILNKCYKDDIIFLKYLLEAYFLCFITS